MRVSIDSELMQKVLNVLGELRYSQVSLLMRALEDDVHSIEESPQGNGSTDLRHVTEKASAE